MSKELSDMKLSPNLTSSKTSTKGYKKSVTLGARVAAEEKCVESGKRLANGCLEEADFAG